jgi:hypothetical protein
MRTETPFKLRTDHLASEVTVATIIVVTVRRKGKKGNI